MMLMRNSTAGSMDRSFMISPSVDCDNCLNKRGSAYASIQIDDSKEVNLAEEPFEDDYMTSRSLANPNLLKQVLVGTNYNPNHQLIPLK
jgi:hypothetical protein